MDADTPNKSPDRADLVGAADAFMTRLRPPAEDDVPVLTDVVEALPATTATTATTATPAANAPTPSPLLTERAKDALNQELENWLDMHLTEAILRVLDGVADQLVAKITREAREDLMPRLHAALQKSGMEET